MKINTGSVVKAGGIAAGIGVVLAILGAIPFLNCLVFPLLCLGAVLLPIGAGMGYGYFTPGREEMTQSATGGALAGGFGGFVYGLVNGIVSMITGAGAAAMLDEFDVAAGAGTDIVGLLGGVCLSVVFGLVLGAIGGVLWPVFQREKI